MVDYKDKKLLAPMVRVGTLPMRMLAAEYGADLVYSEELVALRVMKCQRVENHALRTVDFVSSDRKDTFRTCAAERERVVFQMGVADAVTALKAASVVANDVAVLDINMGCPKNFSLQGGMGAALLQKPEVVEDIVKTLRRNLLTPVSCKIRLLETPNKTAELARVVEAAGACALAVHCRHVTQHSKTPAHWNMLPQVVQSVSIPVIANGDVLRYEDFAAVASVTGCAAAMSARGAMWNPSVFRREGFLSQLEVQQAYLRGAVTWDAHPSNAKYVLKEMLDAPATFTRLQPISNGPLPSQAAVARAKSLLELCAVFDIAHEYKGLVAQRGSSSSGCTIQHLKRKWTGDTVTELAECNNSSRHDDSGAGHTKHLCASNPARTQVVAVLPAPASDIKLKEVPGTREPAPGVTSVEAPACVAAVEQVTADRLAQRTAETVVDASVCVGPPAAADQQVATAVHDVGHSIAVECCTAAKTDALTSS